MRRLVGAVCALAAPVAGVVAVALAFTPADRIPQVAKGRDALSVAFADAKETISAAMVQKADSYFHGGIDIDCHAAHGHDSCRADAHGHHEDHDEDRNGPAGGFDPWRWINSRVRAPERHVHLDGEKAVETLPWFWAAVRADPHNVDAWTTAWYVANNMMKDRALAARVIDEALKCNPNSLEIAFTKARFVYDGGKGNAATAESLLKTALSVGREKCGGRLSELSEGDAETYRRIQEFLSLVQRRR